MHVGKKGSKIPAGVVTEYLDAQKRSQVNDIGREYSQHCLLRPGEVAFIHAGVLHEAHVPTKSKFESVLAAYLFQITEINKVLERTPIAWADYERLSEDLYNPVFTEGVVRQVVKPEMRRIQKKFRNLAGLKATIDVSAEPISEDEEEEVEEPKKKKERRIEKIK